MVELERLRFGYGREALFRDMDLVLEPGAIYGLLGLNGAGKSTLLKLIAGLLFPASGRASVLGHEPAQRKPAFLSSLFVLPEELNVPGITDREYVAARAPFYPDFDRPRLERHLEELEVPRGRKLSSLSHGQQKKFLLSFGLATNASLLMLDEPTAGVSPVVMDDLFDRILEIRGTGIAILMVEQNAAQALSIADRGYVLVTGENRHTDTGAALLADPEVRRSFLGG